MNRLNRDTVIAIILLLVCGVFFWASFDIREPDYGTLKPSTWPRLILVVLACLSIIYFVQSLSSGPDDELEDGGPRAAGLAGWLAHWQNVIWCFGLFLVYLWSMPVLGMLIGGVMFVFLLLNALGGWAPKKLGLHAIIAVLGVGGMWSIFTYGLGVILPPGVIFSAF